MPFSYRIIVLVRGVNQHYALTNAPKLGKLFLLCGYGGIGRRAGFRVQCPRRAGSSPVSRIVSKRAYLRITNVDTLFFMFFNVLTCSNTLFSRRKNVVKKQPGCNPQPSLNYIVLSLINFSSAAPAVSSWRSRICVYTRRVVVMSECPLCRGTAVEHLLHDFLKRLDDRT